MSDPVSRPTSAPEGAVTAVSPWNRLSITTTTLAALLAVALGWSLLRPDPSEVDDSVAIAQVTQGPSLDVSTAAAPRQLVWMNRDRRGGPATPVDPDWWYDRGRNGGGSGHSISPDGTRILLRTFTPEDGYDIWVKELDGGALTRLTFYEGEDRRPVWVDNETVIFLSGRMEVGNFDVWSTRADGTEAPALVFNSARDLGEALWTPDGEVLLIRAMGRTNVRGQAIVGDRDILTVRPGVDSVAQPLMADPVYDESSPTISRDGRWIAYVSTETGVPEVYVRPFPDVDADKVLVSSGGGIMPYWAHNGRELFYVEPSPGASTMTAVLFETTPRFRAIDYTRIFPIPPDIITAPIMTYYDVTQDDRRFLMARVYTGT